MSAVERLKQSKLWKEYIEFTVDDLPDLLGISRGTAHHVICGVRESLSVRKTPRKTYYKRLGSGPAAGSWRTQRFPWEGEHTPRWC